MKKAQTEMMGLVILVILIVVGMMFYVKFGILSNQPKPDTSLDFQRATYIAGAMARVNICENISLQDAVAYCDPQSSQDICGESACKVINDKVPVIISAALGGEFEVGNKSNVDSKKFSFYVMQGDNSIAKIGDCPGKAGTVGTYGFKSNINNKEYSLNYKLC